MHDVAPNERPDAGVEQEHGSAAGLGERDGHPVHIDLLALEPPHVRCQPCPAIDPRSTPDRRHHPRPSHCTARARMVRKIRRNTVSRTLSGKRLIHSPWATCVQSAPTMMVPRIRLPIGVVVGTSSRMPPITSNVPTSIRNQWGNPTSVNIATWCDSPMSFVIPEIDITTPSTIATTDSVRLPELAISRLLG